jgi:hypothetical protein
MSPGTNLLVVPIMLLLGVITAWPHGLRWGFAPRGVLGLVVVIVTMLLLTGRL